jgi:predicted aspartyl protease
MQMIKGKVFIDVTLAGKPVQAMVDSGAAFTGVDETFAATVGVVGDGRSVGMRNIAGTSSGRWSAPAPLAIGAWSTTRPLLVTDFGLLTSTVLHPIRVVLGADFLAPFVVEFDFDAGLLTLHPRAGFSPPQAALVPLSPMSGGSALRTAPMQVEGHKVQALVDTGSQSALIVSPAPARRLKLTAGRLVSTAPIGSFGGPAVGRITTARTLELGGQSFPDVPVQIAARDLGAEGNLGLNLLSRFHLWLDLSGGRMWMKARSEQPPFERDLLGFYGLQDGDDHLRLTFVAKDSPADRAGLKANDIIVRINGEAAFPAQLKITATEGLRLDMALEGGAARTLVMARYY